LKTALDDFDTSDPKSAKVLRLIRLAERIRPPTRCKIVDSVETLAFFEKAFGKYSKVQP
jgi:hypothetical protein